MRQQVENKISEDFTLKADNFPPKNLCTSFSLI